MEGWFILVEQYKNQLKSGIWTTGNLTKLNKVVLGKNVHNKWLFSKELFFFNVWKIFHFLKTLRNFNEM